MSVRGILFDAGDTLYGPIGGRWNPRFDFEEVLLRYHTEVAVDRFTEAFDAGKRFMDAAPSTPPRDDYHRAILSQLGIHDPSSDLLTDLNRPLDVPVVEVFPEVARVLAELREREIRMAVSTMAEFPPLETCAPDQHFFSVLAAVNSTKL